MPAKNDTRTPEEREKAAADRKRQRENVKLKLANRPLLKTPRQLEIERREAAGEIVRRDSKKTSTRKNKRGRTIDESGTDEGDEDLKNEWDDEENHAAKKRLKIGQFQQQLAEDDPIQLAFVTRNDVSVPRLPSTVLLTPEILAGRSGFELAKVLEKQDSSTLFEIFSALQDSDKTVWQRVKNIVEVLSKDELQDRYSRKRFKSESLNIIQNHNLTASIPDTEEGDIDDFDMMDAPPVEKLNSSINLEIEQEDKKSDTEINPEDSADVIMEDLMKAWHVQEGQRAAHLNRELHSSKSIQQDRSNRFEQLQRIASRNKEQVNQKRATFRPQGIRSPAAVRSAFDIVASRKKGPKSAWKNSAEWFMATLNVINSEEQLCLAMFEPRTGHFLADLETAMQKADEEHCLTTLEARSDEEYADLMGAESGTEFEDCFLFFKHQE